MLFAEISLDLCSKKHPPLPSFLSKVLERGGLSLDLSSTWMRVRHTPRDFRSLLQSMFVKPWLSLTEVLAHSRKRLLSEFKRGVHSALQGSAWIE